MDREPEPRALKPKKTAVQLPKRSEADVQADIISLLRHHPKIAMIDRINSGATKMPSGRFVRFNRIYKVRGALSPDIHATLKGNARRFVIECKEPNWKAPDWDALAKFDGLPSEKQLREMGQKAYLDAINAAGGVAMFATSVDDVLTKLEDL